MSILDVAVNFVMKNHWSVIPLRPMSKEPLIQWQEYQKRYPTMSELKSWFENKENNLGIVTGSLSNLSVLDVDELKNLPPQATSSILVVTKRGRHLYFNYSGEQNSVSRIAEKVDVRGEGGYVVAPPSIIDNHVYRFVNPYYRLSDLPRFPIHLLPKKESAIQGKPEGWIAEALQGMKVGNIDNTLISVLGRLRRDGYSKEDARTLLAPHADSAGATEGHLDDKIEHVWKNYENKKVISVNVNTRISRSVTDFLSQESKVEWICFPYISKESLVFLTGLPESKKTWAALDLAIEASRGGKWLGMFPTKKSTVLYIDQERPRSETQRRINAMLAEKGMDKHSLKDSLYVDCSSHRKLDLDVSYESFKHEIAEIKPDIIIVDSFVTVHSRPENDRTEIQKVLDRLKAIREKFGCSTAFINHDSKMSYQDEQENKEPSAGRMVGSIGIVAAPESVITFKKLNDATSTMYNTKNSLTKAAESCIITIVDTDKGIKIEASK